MYYKKTYFPKKPLANEQIRAREVRVVDETGKQLGVMDLEKAFRAAQERGLDLVQLTEKVEPPVCKITDYGKHLYWLEKKKKDSKQQKKGELKGVRLSFNISPHDMELRAKQAEKFLKQGDKVRIELKLRGRQRALQNISQGKFEKFLEILQNLVPIKVERELRKQPRGLTMIVTKA
jgi:translation initiation factor IF-3